MGAKNCKNKDLENKSNSSLYEKSLSSKLSKKNKTSKKNIREEIINELKEEVELPIENEDTESPEVIFEKKEHLKIKNILENNDDDYCLNKFFPEDLFDIKRSKSFVPKPVILETPRLHSKASDNFILSPFKLSIKSYGIVPKWNQKPNKILLDFQKDKIDCKSCNDKEEDILEEFILYNSETEKTTPNLEDLQDLLNCRKKMIKFRNSINYFPCYEYENILNSEEIINDIQKDDNDINEHNYHHHKKKSFWYKHIKNQLKEEKNNYRKSLIHNKRLYSEPFPDIELNCDTMSLAKDNNLFKDDEKEKKEEKEEKDNFDEIQEKEENDDKDSGLFILGVIERAAKERKRTKSVVVK